MIQTLNPFLNFAGNANEAMELYKKVLGATVQVVMRWSEMPGQDVPPALADNIMYAKLQIGGAAIELSDMPPNMELAAGDNMQVILHIDDPAELDKLFTALAEGGQVQMPPDNMFWGARYGKLVDRFGINWVFHCQIEQPGC